MKPSPSRTSARARAVTTAIVVLSLALALPIVMLIAARPAQPAHALRLNQSCTATATALGQVNVRSGPGLQFDPPLGVLQTGQIVQVTGRLTDNSWIQVVFNGVLGWVSGSLVSMQCMGNVPVINPNPAPPTPVPAPGPGTGAPNFRADSFSLAPGQCTTMRWNIDNVRAVFFWDGGNQQGVSGNDTRQVCPINTTTYHLQVVGNDGSVNDFYQTVTVNAASPGAAGVSFTANPASISRGQCATLIWQVNGPANNIVLIDGSSNSSNVVGASGNVTVCPQASSTYILRVTDNQGRQNDTSLNVTVF